MYYVEKKRNLLSSFLPQKPQIDKIRCKNEVLKSKLILLIETINNKITTSEWTQVDYYKFYDKLTKMKVTDFEDVFREILFFLELSKKDLEIKLEDLNQKLGTHIFDAERIIVTSIDPETNKLRQQYSFIPHSFNTGDIVIFLSQLLSRINQYSNVLSSYYQSKLKTSDSTIDEEQTKIVLLLESLENREPSVIGIIEREYQTLLDTVTDDSDKIIKELLKSKLEQIIKNNQASLKNEWQKLETSKNESYRRYCVAAKQQYLTTEAKTGVGVTTRAKNFHTNKN